MYATFIYPFIIDEYLSCLPTCGCINRLLPLTIEPQISRGLAHQFFWHMRWNVVIFLNVNILKTTVLFSIVVESFFTVLLTVHKGSSFSSPPHQHLLLSVFLILAITGYESYWLLINRFYNFFLGSISVSYNLTIEIYLVSVFSLSLHLAPTFLMGIRGYKDF